MQRINAAKVARGERSGQPRTAERRAYLSAKRRCTSEKYVSYHRYGGRGIEFRFESYQQFLDAVGPRPSRTHSLDRINNDGHYEPGNVRWTTMSEQVRNSVRYQRLTTFR
jgi:hypothetical protein